MFITHVCMMCINYHIKDRVQRPDGEGGVEEPNYKPPCANVLGRQGILAFLR